jgi:choice-of-anchor B domain-containing protein
MRNLFLKCLLLILHSVTLFSQLPVNNMSLIVNKNEHFLDMYSAVWGYTAPNGREYAILGCSEGTAFYDVTDTGNVTESDFVPGLSSLWREFKTYCEYAYIVSEAVGSGLQIVDLQYLPDSVSLMNTITFPGYSRTHTISQSGPYLYMNGGDYNNGGIFVFDISLDPLNPVKRGNWRDHYIHDCRVKNDTIWAAAIFDGLIYSISAVNKDSLRTLTSWFNLPVPGPHNTAITDDRKYLYVTDEIGFPPRVMKVWNITNLNNPILESSWQPTGIDSSIGHNVEIYGNYALVAHYSAGVRLLNITDHTNPVEIAWYDTYPENNGYNYDGCWGVYMFPSGKIVASDRQTGLYVLKSSVLPIGINSGNNQLPADYKLRQNYPNPFNPVTKIKYSLSRNTYVKIKIYDATGRFIRSIADGFESAGEHFVVFNGSDLSSGVYFYVLEAGEYIESKKMVLIK